MTELLQLLISGLSIGMIYSLLALSYNMTFATSKTANFSIGSLLTFGAVFAFVFSTGDTSGASKILAPIMVSIILVSVLGFLTFKIAVEPYLKIKAEYSSALATLAVALVLRQSVEKFWSSDDHKLAGPLGDTPLRFLGAGIYPQELVIFSVTILVVLGLEWMLRKTNLGLAIRAVSENPNTASLLGIPQKKVIAVSFVLSAALAGIAGFIVAPMTLVSASMGSVIGIKAYAVSIIGGLSSAYGALLGGAILGLSEVFTARYVSTGYKDTTGFVILVLVILLRPNGLFGQKGVRKV
jgi:branched-chain amino acid transport system permease protein